MQETLESSATSSEETEGSVWDSLLVEEADDFDWEDRPEGSSTPPAAEPTPPAPPVAAPSASPAPAPSTAAPLPPQAPVAPPVVQAPSPEVVQQAREQWLQQLANRYALPDGMVEKLAEEPQTVLPQLAAAVHAQAIEEAVRYGQQVLPQMVEQTIRQRQMYEQAHNAFFSRWPNLRGQDALVTQVAVAYRAANPQASVEDSIDKIGRLSMAYLGISPPDPAAPPAPAPLPPAVPPRPGVASSRAFSPTPTNPVNPFTMLAESFLREDASGFEDS